VLDKGNEGLLQPQESSGGAKYLEFGWDAYPLEIGSDPAFLY